MQHNQLIRQLRLERNLTQAQLAKGIINRSTLSEFERTGTYLSFEIVNRLCQRMNVTLEEYEFVLNDHETTSKRDWAAKIRQQFNHPYQAALSAELLGLYQLNQDFFYYSLYAQYYLVCGFLVRQQRQSADWYSLAVAKLITETIKHHLNGISTWGRAEISLFSNCLFVFDDEYIRMIYQQVLKKTRAVRDSANYSNDLLVFLCNGTELALIRHNEENYQVFAKALRQVGKRYQNADAALHATIYALVHAYHNGKAVQAQVLSLASVLQLCELVHDRQYLLNATNTPDPLV